MIQSRLKLFCRFINQFDLIDKEIIINKELLKFVNGNSVKLNFSNIVVSFDSFKVLLFLRLLLKQRLFVDKKVGMSRFNSTIVVCIDLRKEYFFDFLELNLQLLLLSSNLIFSKKKVLLSIKIIESLYSNLNLYNFLIIGELKKFNANIA